MRISVFFKSVLHYFRCSIIIQFPIIIFLLIEDGYTQLRTRIYTGKIEYEVYSTDSYSTGESDRNTFVLYRGLSQRGVVSYHDHMIVTTHYLDENGMSSSGLELTGGTAAPRYDPLDIGAVHRIVREPLPKVIVDGKVVAPFFPAEVNPDIMPGNVDEMTLASFSYPPGLRVTVKNFAFYNTNHSDYILSEINVQFTRDIQEVPGAPDYPEQTVEGLTWSTGFGFGPTEIGERSQDVFTHLMDDLVGDEWAYAFPEPVTARYPVNEARNQLIVSYTWDDDNPSTAFYDVADPSSTTGEFLSAAVPGFSFLYVDKNPVINPDGYFNDDHTQPYSTGWYSYRDHVRRYKLPAVLTAPGIHLPILSTEPTADPTTQGRLANYQSIGPYNLSQDNQIFRAIYAVGCAALSRSEAVSLGQKWLTGSVSHEEQQQLVRVSLRDSLVDILSRANWAFGRTTEGKDRFTVPPAPHSPDLTVTSGDHKITLEWEDLASQVSDFIEYRIYRSKGSYLDEFSLVFGTGNLENPATTHFVDEDVVLGNQYYYYVTVVAECPTGNKLGYQPLFNGNLESSPFVNRTIEPAIPLDLGKETVEHVLIIPNPWHIQGGAYNYGTITDRRSNNQLTFVNLPSYCQLRIYTLRGELVFEKMHTDGSGTDMWDQTTSSNQEIASGLYLLHISNAYGLPASGQNTSNLSGRKKLPDKIVKFVVVR